MSSEVITPDLTTTQAAELFRALDGVSSIQSLTVETDHDSCEDGPVFTWSARVLVGDHWYDATMPDHWPEGAEIDWSSWRDDEDED